MFHVCVENNRVISIINYNPEVPDGVTVYTISNEEHGALLVGTHYFDTDQGKVLEIPSALAKHRQDFLAKSNGRGYLTDTDWIVLRHIREKTLSLPTSLTEEEYLDLERKRHEVAKGLGTTQSVIAESPVNSTEE